ncbi:YceI family protein [Terriglobus roseus]|uniref:Polyisoprenoid-binding protein YceI n=1 Tax=Terriglobus roseus TaxID=392734 RepID=A0A1G7NMX8_9BACT|nr:YceI family protein [Terriglobus roseus]SDF75418.1 Polyisoprenoid-binding protein YceI [Terriglobus roseus]
MKLLTALALTLLLVPWAVAQHNTFTLDSDSSSVRMTLNTTREVVNGTFRVQACSIEFEPNSSAMSGAVTVLAGSGKTGNDTRDKKMTKSILQAGQYTTVSFAPKAYSGTIPQYASSTIEVTGTFTLLDKPHDMTIPMQIVVDRSKATAKAHFVVPYVQWGLKNPSFLFWKAENDVVIDLSLVGQISYATTH